MRHSNQIGIFWQVKISALLSVLRNLCEKLLRTRSLYEVQATEAAAKSRAPRGPRYFFKFSPRKVVVRFHASAASSGR